MAIKIENIHQGHKQGIHLLLEKVNQVDGLGYSLTNEWLDYIIQNTSQSIFIAKNQEAVIGIATCMINETDPSHGVINIVVHPNDRKRGVGSQLHKKLIQYAKASGIKNLEAYIKERLAASLSFAQNRGFTPILYAWEMSREVGQDKIDLISQDKQALAFKKARATDKSAYAQIINQAFGQALDDSVLEEVLADPSVLVYLLEKDGQAIGSLTLQLRKNLSLAYLYDIAIDEAYRGQGFGTYMIKQSLEVLKAHEIGTASLTVTGENKKALSLYKQLGFREKEIDLLGRVSF